MNTDQMNREQPTPYFEMFCRLTFPHTNALYSDAFCLTGSQEAAADLVVEAYIRAFLAYTRSRNPRTSQKRGTLAWLYQHLHTAFCDGIFTNTPTARNDFSLETETHTGDSDDSIDCTGDGTGLQPRP